MMEFSILELEGLASSLSGGVVHESRGPRPGSVP